jgi:hypothetical protein
VRFETNEKDEIIMHVMPTRLQLGSRDRRKLWWTPEESESMNDRTRSIISSYKQSEDYIRQFIHVFTLCARADEDFQDTLFDDVIQLTQSSARGLEIQIISVLDRYRSKHVEAILDAQAHIPDSVDRVVRDNILSERSLEYSRPGRILARVIANSDSEIVATF